MVIEGEPYPYRPYEDRKEVEEKDDDKCRGFLRGRPLATSPSGEDGPPLESQGVSGQSSGVSSLPPFVDIEGRRSEATSWRSRRRERDTDEAERGERGRVETEEIEGIEERVELESQNVAEEIENELRENVRVTRSEVDLEGEGQKLCRSRTQLLPSILK
ncbi:uncharacterized protein LOC122265772 [Penaeus japonicus]|uniref:uncharacterized protein LOC122265772 n=1 Tax=Penaeus japonicus TaxID=27405 RepID=UPI001C70C06B|nr:uncharacterized protein LOC122265772 [Penaeus japonicus]